MVRMAAPVLLIPLVSLLASTAAGSEPTTSPPKLVLVLYADSRLGYAIQQVDEALRPVLAREAPWPVEYFSEFMDAARFADPADQEALRAYLAARYETRRPDVIIAGGRPALEFLLAHRHTLFPGVPIVHAGLTPEEVPWSKLDDQVVGLTGAWDLVVALELALRLQPATRQVAVVSGVSARDRRLTVTIREAATRMADRLTFTWLDQLTIEQAKTALAGLPPQTVVLFASMYQDAAGRFFLARDALEQIAPASAAPIYGAFENYLGYGVVGGTMETWRSAGEETGRIVLRILGGATPAAAVAGARLPLTTIVDWRQLQRWNIAVANLPPGTEIRYRPPTLWEAYRTQVLVFGAIGLAQLLLIATLAVTLQRRRVAESRRREAEGRAAALRDELAHAARVTLLGELAATLAHEINQPLAAILSNAQATRRWLKADQPDLDEIRAVVEDIIADDKRAGEIIHRMRALIRKGDHTRTRFDLVRSVKDVAALLRGELVASNVSLALDLPDTDLVVEGDEVATQQVLLNLLMNGIQAVQESDPPVRQVRMHATAVDGMARLVVHDTGRGVPEEMREKLFEPFFTTKARGLGVGLAICRRIAEAHGGSLDLDTSSPAGATFVLALPVEARAA